MLLMPEQSSELESGDKTKQVEPAEKIVTVEPTEETKTAKPATPPTVESTDKDKKAFGTVTQTVMAVVVVVILFILGLAGSLTESVLLLSVVVGCVGGLIHDLIQNKAIILYPSTTDEGVYIGWILGVILGGAAGFIAYSSGVVSTTFDPKLLAAPFTAGIALKGVVDAAANTSASNVKTKSQ